MRPDHFAPDPAAKVEPSAAARKMGSACFDNYTGLVQAGFTEQQALHIIGVILSAIFQNTQQ